MDVRDRFGLSGRRALVTGAGMGIGRAVAVALAESGARVVLHHHASAGSAADTIADLRARGHEAHALGADLHRVEETRRLVDRAVDLLGGLDVLVNNAGVTRSVPIDEEEPEPFERLLALNLGAPYFAIQRALPELAVSGHGAVINLTSIHAAAGFAGHSAYAATKGALVALTRELAIELAPRHIRVNAIGPGLIEVPRYFDIPGYTTALGDSMVPLGRVGRPEDAAWAAVYLASDLASFVTGEVLWVDGGTQARMGLAWPRSDIDESGQG